MHVVLEHAAVNNHAGLDDQARGREKENDHAQG